MFTALALILGPSVAHAELTEEQIADVRQWLYGDGIACGSAGVRAERQWGVGCPTVPLNLPPMLCVHTLSESCEQPCSPTDEVAYDGIDQDCDGADLVDADGDGHDAGIAGGDDCLDTNPEVVHCGGAVVEVSPSSWALRANRNAEVRIRLGCEPDPTTIHDGSLLLWGEQSGFIGGIVSVDGEWLSLAPAETARAGERMSAVLTTEAACADGTVAGPVTWRWTTAVTAGTGVLRQEATGSAGTDTCKTVATDLDGDGALELISADMDVGAVNVFDTSAGMAWVQSIDTVGYPMRLAGADVDADGDVDVLTVGSPVDVVELLRSDASGSLRLSRFSTTTGGYPVAVGVGDVDGDGDLDAVVAAGADDAVEVYLNDGSGRFALSSAMVLPGANPHDIEVADLDGDLDLDVVTVGLDDGMFHVLANDGTGAFAEIDTGDVGYTAIALWVNDLDGDGVADVVAGTQYNRTMTVFEGDGTGNLDEGQTFSVNGNLDVCGGDFDADGDVDLVLCAHDGHTFETWRNDGVGTFSPWTSVSTGSYCTFVACGDMDGDGAFDAAVTRQYEGEVLLYLNTP